MSSSSIITVFCGTKNVRIPKSSVPKTGTKVTKSDKIALGYCKIEKLPPGCGRQNGHPKENKK